MNQIVIVEYLWKKKNNNNNPRTYNSEDQGLLNTRWQLYLAKKYTYLKKGNGKSVRGKE